MLQPTSSRERAAEHANLAPKLWRRLTGVPTAAAALSPIARPRTCALTPRANREVVERKVDRCILRVGKDNRSTDLVCERGGAGVGSEKNPSVAVMHHIIARYALLIDISAEYSRHREAGQREVQPWAQSEWPRLRYNNNEKVSPILTTQSTARLGGKLYVEYGTFVSLENSFDQDYALTLRRLQGSAVGNPLYRDPFGARASSGGRLVALCWLK